LIGRCQGVSVCASVTNRSQRGPERLENWLRGLATNIICSFGAQTLKIGHGPFFCFLARHLGRVSQLGARNGLTLHTWTGSSYPGYSISPIPCLATLKTSRRHRTSQVFV
jgi:hypothetical protein